MSNSIDRISVDYSFFVVAILSSSLQKCKKKLFKSIIFQIHYYINIKVPIHIFYIIIHSHNFSHNFIFLNIINIINWGTAVSKNKNKKQFIDFYNRVNSLASLDYSLFDDGKEKRFFIYFSHLCPRSSSKWNLFRRTSAAI